MNQLQDIAKALKKLNTIAIFTHTNPDGDALGSSFALKAILESVGKRAVVILEKEMPKRYMFLNDGYSLFEKPEMFDGAIALDSGSANRLGTLKDLYLSMQQRLVLDHHYADIPYGDVYYSDPESAACVELVYALSKEICDKLPAKALVPLYTGLSTDTGQFKYSNVTSNTMIMAAELLAAGLDHRPITRALYDTVTLNKLKFTGALAEKIGLYNNETIAVLYCPDSFLESYHLTNEEVEELPNTVLSIESVLVSVIIKDKDEKTLKVSLRCKENIDMAVLASMFGGGGHKCAAGFVTELSADALTEKIVAIISEQLEEYYANAKE